MVWADVSSGWAGLRLIFLCRKHVLLPVLGQDLRAVTSV